MGMAAIFVIDQNHLNKRLFLYLTQASDEICLWLASGIWGDV